MFDWQLLAVYLVVGAAAWSLVRRVRALAGGQKPSGSCPTCNRCAARTAPLTDLGKLAVAAPPNRAIGGPPSR